MADTSTFAAHEPSAEQLTRIAAQLMAEARRRLPGLDAEFAAGRFDTLLGWLRREVHAAGRMLESDPLVERATGREVTVDWLVASLRDRYGAAYGL